MVAFCQAHGVAHDVCGKLVVATSEDELPRLENLRQRGLENGLAVRRLDPAEIRQLSNRTSPVWRRCTCRRPASPTIRASPRRCAAASQTAGGVVRLDAAVLAAREGPSDVVVRTTAGEFHVGAVVACAGLHADRVAAMCGLDTDVVIAPFRGEYYQLRAERTDLVRHLVYPVPDPRFPFLGVHFTRMALGGVEAGPNAVIALAREGYRWRDVSMRDVAAGLASPGVRRFVGRHLATGVAEVRRSLSRRRFAASLARLVPAVSAADLVPGGAGVRAMALTPDGRLMDDFHFVDTASDGARPERAVAGGDGVPGHRRHSGRACDPARGRGVVVGRRDYLINVTGTSARCTTLSAVEPSSRLCTAPNPRVPMTIASHCRSRLQPAMVVAASPTRAWVVTVMPAASNCLAAGSSTPAAVAACH